MRKTATFPGGLIGSAPWPSSAPGFAPVGAASAIDLDAADASAGSPSVLEQHNVCADRRTCPRLFDQLKDAAKRAIDTLVCNFLDDDPAARPLAAVGASFIASITAGLRLLAQLHGVRTTVFVLDHSAPAWLRKPATSAARQLGATIVALPARYPQSDASILLHTLLRRKLHCGDLPTAQRVLLLDSAAAMAIGQLAVTKQPMQAVPLAIHDTVNARVHYRMVPVGMTIVELARTIEGRGGEWTIGEGPRMAVLGPDAVIHDGEFRLNLLNARQTDLAIGCTRCGECLHQCPTNLNPAALLEAAQEEDDEMARRSGISACILCGVCQWVCPARLPLLDGLRKLKSAERR